MKRKAKKFWAPVIGSSEYKDAVKFLGKDTLDYILENQYTRLRMIFSDYFLQANKPQRKRKHKK